MPFVNTLPYISNPIPEFKDFRFVSWESEIYPILKGGTKKSEMEFFAGLIASNNAKSLIDFGTGGGVELSGIVKELDDRGYELDHIAGNEVDEDFIKMARAYFVREGQNIPIHRANWLDLPKADPPYERKFDFGYLTGNSLTYIGGGTRDYTQKAQRSVLSKFAELIEPGGHLFIDSRNYDYIRSLMHLPPSDIFKHFSFNYTIYYHAVGERVVVFPAYISETVVVLHYYDKQNKTWSKLDLYPIYQTDMIENLSENFEIEKVYHDLDDGHKDKSLFVQYLARRKES